MDPEAEARDRSSVTARVRSSLYGRLLARDDFRLLWLAQLVSTVGTYTYSLAVASMLTQHASGAALARAVALVLGIQAGAGAVSGLLLAGPVADRFDRRRVMIISDIARFVAVATLLVGTPSPVHLGAVAAVLGCFGALFDPCLTASLPNVVDGDDLVPANAVIGSTFYGSAMVGPGLGAVLVAVFGTRLAFSLNALSFVASAALLASTTFRRTPEHNGRLTPLVLARDLRDGARYVLASPLAVAILVTMGLAILASGAQAPLQIVFVRQVLAPEQGAGPTRAIALAALTTAWASGMLVGSLLSPLVIHKLPRERLIPLALAVIGACVIIGATHSSLASVGALWFIAGSMCGATNVSYESLLQERTPDAFRGRVIATIEAAQEASYLVGVALAAAVSAALSAADALKVVGVVSVLAAVVGSWLLHRNLDRTPVNAPAAPGIEVELRTRISPVIGGRWPEWVPVPTPWVLTRIDSVAALDARWPLVARDWEAIIAELSEAIETGVTAVVLPTALPPGSSVTQHDLEHLWSTLLSMSIIVRRTPARGHAAGASDEASPERIAAAASVG